MGVSNKVKGLMQIRGKTHAELKEYLGFAHTQALTNKFARGSFSAEDLIKIADFLDCELAFILSDNQRISLDMSDLRQRNDS